MVVIGMEMVGGAEVEEKEFWASEIVWGVLGAPAGIMCALFCITN